MIALMAIAMAVQGTMPEWEREFREQMEMETAAACADAEAACLPPLSRKVGAAIVQLRTIRSAVGEGVESIFQRCRATSQSSRNSTVAAFLDCLIATGARPRRQIIALAERQAPRRTERALRPGELGRWVLRSEPNPMTDAAKFNITLEGRGGLIQIGCDSSTPGSRRYLTIGSNLYLGGRPIVREVLLRFDSQAPVAANWGHADRFIAAMEDASRYAVAISLSQRLLVRATDYRSVNVDIAFDLTGSAAAVRALDHACQGIGM